MKRLIFLSLLIFACSSDDDKDCKCDVKIITVDEDQGVQTGEYTITNVDSDCNGNVDVEALSEDLPSNHWYSGTENCRE